MKRCGFLIPLTISLLLSAPALAQSWPELGAPPAIERIGENDIAVVVAIEDYAFLPDVPGAGRNAADWERFLSDGLGIKQVLMLTNQQAVREEILAFAEKAATQASEGSTVWFVFIGHGGPSKDGSDGLLIGADGQQNTNSMAARGLPQKELISALEGGKQGRTIVLIDACFSGRGADGAALAKGAMPVVAVNATPAVATTTVVMTAAQADEFAGDLPGADRPAFSYLMLGAMRGWADDGDGEVTAAEAVAMARRELLGIPGRQQTPQLVGGKGIVLSRGANEARPPKSGVTAANVSPDSSITTAVVPATTDATDGIPDSPFYLHAAGGLGALDDFGSLGVVGDFGLGAKINGFSKTSRNEWRVGLRAGLASTANSSAPKTGDTISDGTEIFADDNPEQSSQFGWVAGPEVGRAWRSESKPGLMGDSVFVLSALGLYGNISQCNGWELNTDSGRNIVCSTPKDKSGGGGGLSAAAQFGVIRVGALVAFLVDFPVFASFTAGLTYDL